MLTFHECKSCADKPGSPVLCDSCLRNRETIMLAGREIRKLKSAIKIISDVIELEKTDVIR